MIKLQTQLGRKLVLAKKKKTRNHKKQTHKGKVNWLKPKHTNEENSYWPRIIQEKHEKKHGIKEKVGWLQKS